MKSNNIYYYLFLLVIYVVSSCSNEGSQECLKTITIPQIFNVGNQFYTTSRSLEVPCDFPEPTEPEIIEPPLLENFSYQILSFTYTPDTGNNTFRIQFEIQLNNGNNFDVNGVPLLTIVTDGLEVTGSYSDQAVIPCLSLPANSNCVLTYDQEDSLDLGAPTFIQITNVEYIVTD